jgi:transcriptional regulator with PAS, ATPase and Fis domain
MRTMFARLERAAVSDSTVLLTGESGSGKDVIAQSLHEASPRARGPFVIVDCGAIPPGLIESELFGHERGAFTGAEAARAGAIEEAHGGTLFLDEVGELPLEMQPRFLRALDHRQVRPVGAADYREADVRVIAATNRDLSRAVGEGRFRSDLYYRLAVIQVAVPPLRHHREDVALLARHFVTELRPNADPEAVLTRGVLDVLGAHNWPGNVRELRNAVEHLLAMGQVAPLGDDDRAVPPPPYADARRLALESFEREYCRALLAGNEGVVARAAAHAGISRQMFHRIMRKHALTGQDT